MNTAELTEAHHSLDKRVAIVEVEQKNCRREMCEDIGAAEGRIDDHEARIDTLERKRDKNTAVWSAIGSGIALLVAFIITILTIWIRSRY